MTLLVLSAALFAGWYSTTRVLYFSPTLLKQVSACPSPNGGYEPAIDRFQVDWFGGELRALGEPSLYLASTEGPTDGSGIIRFTWLRSFHNPVVVRVEFGPDGAAWLTAKERRTGTAGGRERRLSRPLTAKEIQQLESLVSSTRVLEQPPSDCAFGSDGSTWIIEAASSPGEYVYINRWSPEAGPVHSLGLQMIAMTGWRFEEIY
jgi:hypothetical protein